MCIDDELRKPSVHDSLTVALFERYGVSGLDRRVVLGIDVTEEPVVELT